MRPGGVGRRSAIMVRVLHSIIRHTMLPHAKWDRDRPGMPISQFGMLGTLLLSSFAPGQQLKLIRLPPTDDDILARSRALLPGQGCLLRRKCMPIGCG
jgi:hypothetical protein